MNDRIQQYLDGELTAGELSELELREAHELRALMGGVLDAIPVPSLPDLGDGVLRAVRVAPARARRSFARRAFAWLWRPRPFSMELRPAWAVAAAVAVLVVSLVRAEPQQAVPHAVQATAQPVFIQFRLEAPQAQQVALAGDFTDWQPAYQLNRLAGGVWTVVVAVRPGVHDYAFVVDGRHWTADPAAPAVSDGFGGVNSRVAVLAPEQST